MKKMVNKNDETWWVGRVYGTKNDENMMNKMMMKWCRKTRWPRMPLGQRPGEFKLLINMQLACALFKGRAS